MNSKNKVIIDDDIVDRNYFQLKIEPFERYRTAIGGAEEKVELDGVNISGRLIKILKYMEYEMNYYYDPLEKIWKKNPIKK